MYNLVKDDINAGNEWDEQFIKELDCREKSFFDGSAKMYTWEDTKQAAIDKVNKHKKYGLPTQNTSGSA